MAAQENNGDDFLASVRDMAEKIGLTGDEAGQYVHEHMTRAGWTMVPSYVKDDGGTDQSGGFFKSGGNKAGDKTKGKGGWFPG